MCISRNHWQLRKAQGLTLIEVLIAITIGAAATLLAYQALSGAIRIEERVSEVSEQTKSLQRLWQFLNDDIQHVVARPRNDYLGNAQPALSGLLGDRQSQSSSASVGEDSHLLRFVRAGENNIFQQQRSNLQVVGYRIIQDDEIESDDNEPANIQLWRDYWRPVDGGQEPEIKSRLLLEKIKSIQFRYLSGESESVDDQAWVTGWPESATQNAQLPIAVEVTIDVDELGEIMRLFTVINDESKQ